MKTLDDSLREALSSIRAEAENLPDRKWEPPTRQIRVGAGVALAAAALVLIVVGLPALLRDGAGSSPDYGIGSTGDAQVVVDLLDGTQIATNFNHSGVSYSFWYLVPELDEERLVSVARRTPREIAATESADIETAYNDRVSLWEAVREEDQSS